MRRRSGWFGTAAALVLALAARAASALEIGDKAPEIDVSEWVQGGPVKIADGAGAKVHLIVLWGTFQDDGAAPLTRLNSVYGKMKASGLEIVAVSTEPAEVVRKFLVDEKLEYPVAVDQFHKTADAYGGGKRMKLPASWIVDKSGMVVWSGDPSWGIEGTLKSVLDGKFDHTRAKAVQDRQQKLWNALIANDWTALAAACDEILATEPGDEQAFSFRMLTFRVKDDKAGFKAFMSKHVERCKDDAGALSRAARELAFDVGSDWRDIELAHGAAKRAVETSKSGDADVLETYARILFTAGLVDQAIAEEKKAVALEDKEQGHKQLLAYFEACAAARKKTAPPTAKAPPTKK